MATNTFIHGVGLVSFDWFDAGNWSGGVPALGADVLVNYAPGFGYKLAMGANGGVRPDITVGTLTLDAPTGTLEVNSSLFFGTLDLKAGVLTAGFSNFPAPTFHGGTILAEGGQILGAPVLNFKDVSWRGNLALSGSGGGIEFQGTNSFGALAGGARPAMTLGRHAVILRGTQTLGGIDVVQSGTSSLTFGENNNTAGAGTLAGDVTFTSSGVQDKLVADFLSNLGHIVVSGGDLTLGPVTGNALTLGEQGSFTNAGTIDISNGATLLVGTTMSGAGRIRVGGGGTLQTNYEIGPLQTIDLLAGADHLTLPSNRAVEADIVGFQAGDSIEMGREYNNDAPSFTYSNGVVTLSAGPRYSTSFYIGTGYDPANFVVSAATSDPFTGAKGPMFTTTTAVAPAFVPFSAPAPGAGVAGASNFIPTDGRFVFDFNDAANWTGGVPGTGTSAISYAPGYGYAVRAGTTLFTAGGQTLFAPDNFILDSPNATLEIATNMVFGTLDLKAGVLSGRPAPAGVPDMPNQPRGDRAPSVTGTILADGGTLDAYFAFKGLTWVGDLAIASRGGAPGFGIVYHNGLSILPKQGGVRPVLDLNGSLEYLAPDTISGLDIHSSHIDQFNFQQGATLAADVSVTRSGSNTGTLQLYPVLGSTLTSFAPMTATAGTIEIGYNFSPGYLVNNSTISAAGGVVALNAPVSGTGGFHVSAGGTIRLFGTLGAGQSIVFDDASGHLLLGTDSFNSFFHGFRAGDTIALPDFNGTITPTVAYNSGILTVVNNSGTHLVPVGPGYDPASFHVTANNGTGFGPYTTDITTTSAVPCFAEGTPILTARGAVAVEELRVGDLVVTPEGGTAPVVWTGHRRVRPHRHARPASVNPIVIRAGAIGPGVPSQDLWLSPDHALLLDGLLVPASCLVNQGSVFQVPVREITYWHVELPKHGVLLAAGAACESYLDTGNRSDFAGAAASLALHPMFASAREAWAALACAPQCRYGAPLELIRARLAARAAGMAPLARPAW